jgi:hypothetical protein
MQSLISTSAINLLNEKLNDSNKSGDINSQREERFFIWTIIYCILSSKVMNTKNTSNSQIFWCTIFTEQSAIYELNFYLLCTVYCNSKGSWLLAIIF